MPKINPPPISTPIVIDREGYADTPWVEFFNQVFIGDTGTSFTPTFTSLTTVGAPTFAAKYYKIGPLCYFNITITPSTSTTAIAGTTYSNLPLTARGNGIVFAVSGNLGDGPGMISVSENRAYVPAWSAVTVPLTVIGIYEAQ